MKNPDLVFTHHVTGTTHTYHPANQYTFHSLLKIANNLITQGKATNLWIGEDSIQYDKRHA